MEEKQSHLPAVTFDILKFFLGENEALLGMGVYGPYAYCLLIAHLNTI